MVQPLDLYSIFVENLAGSATIFFFLALVVMIFVASKFRMYGLLLFVMIGLFSTMFADWIGRPIYAFIVLIGAMLIYLAFSKFWTR